MNVDARTFYGLLTSIANEVAAGRSLEQALTSVAARGREFSDVLGETVKEVACGVPAWRAVERAQHLDDSQRALLSFVARAVRRAGREALPTVASLAAEYLRNWMLKENKRAKLSALRFQLLILSAAFPSVIGALAAILPGLVTLLASMGISAPPPDSAMLLALFAITSAVSALYAALAVGSGRPYAYAALALLAHLASYPAASAPLNALLRPLIPPVRPLTGAEAWLEGIS